MIKTTAIGHLGNDAIVNSVNNKNVINFNIAHTEKFKNSEGVDVNKTVWINCSYWNEKLNIANYLKKGIQVYVEGVPSVKSYTDKNGVVQNQLALRITNIQLLGGGQKTTQEQNTQQEDSSMPPQRINQQQSTEDVEYEDDLPF
jgi:single-strand DNA-binding protein